MPPSEKRRNFTGEEDLALLRQAAFDRPFLSERGGVIAAWDSVAATLVGDAGFPRDKLSGKHAQARLDKLIRRKRDANTVALAASGVAEEETEAKSQKDAAKRKRDEDEEASRNVRRLAMQRLRDESTTLPRKRKEEEMREFVLQLKKQEIEARKEEQETKAAQRAEERQKDRDFMLALAEMIGQQIAGIVSANRS
ncbi:uncharacterized protein PITG_09590 [Phytophthora infestans T30-4]|uniref:Uncharacterized protein n=1 Tax=Phytophthora infestans (strain T30-4) TaxID=403677 RepID=D0NCC6_PHYIT|nr:uncharacterized protein PITG_09590 [Phytophthora infestans T30-4]EEY55640.1 conserved hypothetical protein [Phytophthora infestans T30-4]|eukprot:XP_002903216.1 conserved hypothetical protein [Phytophthora infestans T30-4]